MLGTGAWLAVAGALLGGEAVVVVAGAAWVVGADRPEHELAAINTAVNNAVGASVAPVLRTPFSESAIGRGMAAPVRGAGAQIVRARRPMSPTPRRPRPGPARAANRFGGE